MDLYVRNAIEECANHILDKNDESLWYTDGAVAFHDAAKTNGWAKLFNYQTLSKIYLQAIEHRRPKDATTPDFDLPFTISTIQKAGETLKVTVSEPDAFFFIHAGDFLSSTLFRKTLFVETSIVMPPVKQKLWDEFVSAWAPEIEEIDISTQDFSIVEEALQDFLSGVKHDKPDMLRAGLPVTTETKTYFRINDLLKLIKKDYDPQMTRSRVTFAIQFLGYRKDRLSGIIAWSKELTARVEL